jgi:hypothetical protein
MWAPGTWKSGTWLSSLWQGETDAPLTPPPITSAGSIGVPLRQKPRRRDTDDDLLLMFLQ